MKTQKKSVFLNTTLKQKRKTVKIIEISKQTKKLFVVYRLCCARQIILICSFNRLWIQPKRWYYDIMFDCHYRATSAMFADVVQLLFSLLFVRSVFE
jgi:hypothetical protein